MVGLHRHQRRTGRDRRMVGVVHRRRLIVISLIIISGSTDRMAVVTG